MKTVSVALVLCLNVGVDPPDVVKINPCARLECWVGKFVKRLLISVEIVALNSYNNATGTAAAFSYRQDCVKRKLLVLNLLTGWKLGFLNPHRVTHCTDSYETWHGWRACGYAWLCKIWPQSAQVDGNAAQNMRNFSTLW